MASCFHGGNGKIFMASFFLDYCLIKLLTRKTLREIYLAYSTRDPLQQVIIKIFDQTCSNQKQDESSAYAHTLLALKHPHLVPILDIGVGEQGQPYVVSDYRARGSLRQGLSRLSSGKMDWKEAINITMQVGQALIYLHQ